MKPTLCVGQSILLPEWARSRVRRRGDRRYASSYLRTPSAFHRPYQTQVLLRSIDDGEHSLVWSGYGDTHELYSRDGDPLERKNMASTDRDRVRALLSLMDETTSRWAAPEADGGSAEGNSVSQATLDLIPTVLGFSQVPGTAVVAGTVFDCAGDPVYGAEVRLYREDGSPILEGTANADPHYRYFDGDDFGMDHRDEDDEDYSDEDEDEDDFDGDDSDEDEDSDDEDAAPKKGKGKKGGADGEEKPPECKQQ
mgnify:CR=1 FL=1